MQHELPLVLLFGGGVVAQALFMARDKASVVSLLFMFAIGFFILHLFSSPGDKQFYEAMFFPVFGAVFAAMFKKENLPVISELTVLSFTITFWFAFLKYFWNPLNAIKLGVIYTLGF